MSKINLTPASAASPIAIVLSAAMILSSAGCASLDSQVQSDGAAISTAILNVAAIEEATNPTLAANLITAANALKSATVNFSSANGVSIVNDALNAAEVALAAIPQTAQIAPLIPIAEAAIDILIANIESAQPALVAHARVSHPAAVIPHRVFRSREGDFKAAWNEKAKSLGLAVAVIQ